MRQLLGTLSMSGLLGGLWACGFAEVPDEGVDSANPVDTGEGVDGGPPGGDGGDGGGDGGDGGDSGDSGESCFEDGTGLLEIFNNSRAKITLLISWDCEATMDYKTMIDPLRAGDRLLLDLRAGEWTYMAMVKNTCTEIDVVIEADEATEWEITGFEGELVVTEDGWGCE